MFYLPNYLVLMFMSKMYGKYPDFFYIYMYKTNDSKFRLFFCRPTETQACPKTNNQLKKQISSTFPIILSYCSIIQPIKNFQSWTTLMINHHIIYTKMPKTQWQLFLDFYLSTHEWFSSLSSHYKNQMIITTPFLWHNKETYDHC